ncbi:family 25 protein [Tupanvirus deep ocean]|uniref:Family 25 protein n=2 Tax=Tupanvirus TaxID=2094720 RepID=A0AC62A9Q5_9VIRU|nr:family 25 protein [Tupanvirus deep ocean]QKU34380.1 family 25 protein [Tupanvirus deep ocean]
MILENFPKVLWINLERSTERRSQTEKLLNEHGINHTRISAVDGLDASRLKKICHTNKKISKIQNAITCSHLYALKYFVEQMSDEKIVVFEDDIDFEFLKYVPYSTWSEFEINLPPDYNVVQMCTIYPIKNNVEPSVKLVKKDQPIWSACAYLIKRSAAINILQKYMVHDIVNLRKIPPQHAVADFVVYDIDNVYVVPIFTYQNKDTTNPYHNDHDKLLHHENNKIRIRYLWILYNLSKLYEVMA